MSLSRYQAKPLSVARSAAIVVVMRWTDRLIGIVSTLILARLLVPADFGIVAMASLVVALTDSLLDLGVTAALVQNRDADRPDFDTAWTLRLLQSAVAAGLIGLVAAPLAAGYFNDARVTDVLRVMAMSVFIGGFENIGIVVFQKNMEFGKDFQFFAVRRVIGFLATISLALLLHSYWAMVLGAMTARVAGVGLSYWMHDFRPRFSLARFASLWSFSQWILVRNLGSYGAQQTDKLLVGRRADAGSLGAYTVADQISAMPTGELLMPLGRVLFPVFARAKGNPNELQRAFCLALGVQALVAVPAGVGLALVADLATALLLGEKWLEAIPFVQTLALTNVFLALTHSSGYLLLALGRVKLQAILSWAQFALLLALLLLVFPGGDAQSIAFVRLGVAALIVPLLLAMVLAAVPLVRIRDLIAHTYRPILATAVMGAVLLLLDLPTSWPLWARLASEILTGVCMFTASVLLLWRLAKYRDGAERYLLNVLRFKHRLGRIMDFIRPSR